MAAVIARLFSSSTIAAPGSERFQRPPALGVIHRRTLSRRVEIHHFTHLDQRDDKRFEDAGPLQGQQDGVPAIGHRHEAQVWISGTDHLIDHQHVRSEMRIHDDDRRMSGKSRVDEVVMRDRQVRVFAVAMQPPK